METALSHQGRLLLLSPFDSHVRRPRAQLAGQRTRLVVALADKVLIAHAEPGGKLEALARESLAAGKQVLTLAVDANANLVSLGATVVAPADIKRYL